MSMSDTLKIEVTGIGGSGGGNTGDNGASLKHSLDNLAAKFSSFETALTGFVAKTKQQNDVLLQIRDRNSQTRQTQANDPGLRATDRIRAETSKLNAAFRSSPEGVDLVNKRYDTYAPRNRAAELREKNLNSVNQLAQNARERGDLKTATKYENAFVGSVTNAFNKGIEGSKLKSVMSAIAGIGAIGIATNATKGIINSNQNMASILMQNPITNGYDYGSVAGGALNTAAQQKYGMISAGSALAGAGIGLAIGGPIGAVVGGGIAAAGEIFGSMGKSKAALQAQALSSYTNNYMNLEALSGTNQAAAGIIGNKISNKGDVKFTDIEAPLIMTIAKGAAIYDKNFKAMDELTKYAKSAQLSLSQVATLSAGTAYFGRDKSFSPKAMLDQFNTYGITPDQYGGIFARSQNYTQAGMSASDALSLATRSTGINPNVQGAMDSYFSQDLIERSTKVFIAQGLLGENLETMGKNGNYSKEALAAKKRVQRNISQGSLPDPIDILRNGLYSGGLYSVGESALDNLAIKEARINPSSAQESFINTTNKTSRDAFAGKVDVEAASMAIGKWAESVSGGTINLDAFKGMMTTATEAVTNFKQSIDNVNSSFQSSSGAQSSALKLWYVKHKQHSGSGTSTYEGGR